MDDYGKVVSVFLTPAICDRCGEKCLPDMRFATRILCKFCGDEILSSAQPMPDDKIKHKGKPMKDELSFPAFTHDSIAGYCNDKPLYAQYKNDKKSKYIGTKQMWQELSKLRYDLETAREALEEISSHYQDEMGKPTLVDWYSSAKKMCDCAEKAIKQIDHIADASKMVEHKGGRQW